MSKHERIIAPETSQIIQSGDLVWGGWFRKSENFQRFLQQGILPHSRQDDGHHGCSPDAVCFGLISHRLGNPWSRYDLTSHHGPKSHILIPNAEIHIGILVSRHALLRIFKSRVEAVGSDFSSPIGRLKYGYDPFSNTVMGIPIVHYESSVKPYKDEVIVDYAGNDVLPAITSGLWRAVIVYPFQELQIKQELRTSGLGHLPVIAVPFQ